MMQDTILSSYPTSGEASMVEQVVNAINPIEKSVTTCIGNWKIARALSLVIAADVERGLTIYLHSDFYAIQHMDRL